MTAAWALCDSNASESHFTEADSQEGAQIFSPSNPYNRFSLTGEL